MHPLPRGKETRWGCHLIAFDPLYDALLKQGEREENNGTIGQGLPLCRSSPWPIVCEIESLPYRVLSYPINEGRNMETGDQNETNISMMNIIIQNGTIAFVASSIDNFPIEQPTKSADPTGGVVSPMARFRISMMPNWMGSIPR